MPNRGREPAFQDLPRLYWDTATTARFYQCTDTTTILTGSDMIDAMRYSMGVGSGIARPVWYRTVGHLREARTGDKFVQEYQGVVDVELRTGPDTESGLTVYPTMVDEIQEQEQEQEEQMPRVYSNKVQELVDAFAENVQRGEYDQAYSLLALLYRDYEIIEDGPLSREIKDLRVLNEHFGKTLKYLLRRAGVTTKAALKVNLKKIREVHTKSLNGEDLCIPMPDMGKSWDSDLEKAMVFQFQ